MGENNILKNLNDRQKEAVTATEGPVLVIAGPGSGKTRALTHHIAYLIALGRRPQEILAVTFTNKAAGEMRERVGKLLIASSKELIADGKWPDGNNRSTPVNKPSAISHSLLATGRGPFIGTFHSFAAFILRQEARHLGWQPHFTIFDEDDSLGLVKEVMKELNVNPKNFPPGMVASVISSLKNDLIAVDEYEGLNSAEPFGRTIGRIYEEYQQRLKQSNAFDFDDLIFMVVRLFLKNPQTLERWQNRFRYVHIDEYQDTNTSQYELIQLLAKKHGNIFAIGDDSQAIYAWRHADYRNITNFERDWPRARVILLEENYRSTPEIIEAANHVIAKNKNQKPKTLWTKNQSGAKPQVRAEVHERSEAEFIAREIAELERGGFDWRDVAVLYRTNAQSRAIEEAMIQGGIPYVIIGGIRFFQRREIKDLTAYLRFLQNPEDKIAEKRIINVPARGIGPKTFLSYLARKTAELPEREAKKIAEFEAVIGRLGEGMKEKTLAEFLRFLIKTIGYEDYIRDFSADGDTRVENVRELVTVARKYDGLPIEEATVKLLEEIALASDQDQIKDDNQVKLMTIHASKGLEFRAVFVAGLEEGLLPHSKSIQAGQAELEEERRLCYVAMTRAKEKLFLTWALQRTIFGETQASMPSRFLFELPEDLLARQNFAEREDAYIIDGDE